MIVPRAAITTILFTDLVGSTELLQQVGDEEGQRIFMQHHKLLSEVVTTTSGQELQWLGDGLMAAFPSTADAVRCAVAMQRASAQPVLGHHLSIRVGLNVGEVLQQESDSSYFGTSRAVARRLCDRAHPRQILCSSTVAGLLNGRQAFRFRDLDPLALKGIAPRRGQRGPVRRREPDWLSDPDAVRRAARRVGAPHASPRARRARAGRLGHGGG